MARYMIDTNILCFMIEEDDRLSKDVKAIVTDCENTLFVSAESVKELVVAHRNKNLLANRWKTADELVNAIKKQYRFVILPVDINTIHSMAKLEINEAADHKDPSDHLIIAHAITMGMPLISNDRKFPFYKSQGLELVTNF
ncbi:MAG: type II toxin-antitoxin system VapC family toxin [Bacteroidales bacterium]|nr:type II toxin-antitoxin system VapC family toxin [Bacteroidales bacterium]